MVAWLPLVGGIARIGVLCVTAERLTPALLDGATQLAAVTVLTILPKSGFSDLFSRSARRRPMTTAAEMVWAFLPPRTLRSAVSLRPPAGWPVRCYQPRTVACISHTRISAPAGSSAVMRWPPVAVKRTASPS